MAKKVKRLFDQFQPDNYQLELAPDREEMAFTGRVTIVGRKTGRPSRRITLHQNGLKITSAHVIKHDKRGDKVVDIVRVNHHNGFEEVRLHARDTLYPGAYTIELEFKGKITRQMSGIYPCYFKHGGKMKTLIATQFESHHAREAFPCVDEPEAKATFELTLTTPANETVLANTPIISQEKKGAAMLTRFEPTPKMSTYLLAFAYGELGFKETTAKAGVTLRAYATPDNVRFTDFALETAGRCLDFYNDYFGIPYPLPKCDLIALPDFASGAMENWGLITFREQALLVDPKNSTLSNKQYVAMVVAHELAHQWFGNLVTMRWWTDLWLNEGFASWIEFLATDRLFPDWQVWTQFAIDEQQQALKLDALEHTHPIEVPVNHPDEIRTVFDTISYSKGASVIHMLHDYLGADVFQAGLRHYLNRHAYANTDTVDLWASLEEISGQPVRDFMHQWTARPGFPLVKATVGERDVSLEQNRFYQNPTARRADANETIWPIPLQSHDDGLPEQLRQREAILSITDSHRFKLNRGQSGFYRTVYNSSHLTRLGELIRRGGLGPLDRLGVFGDLFESAKAGLADTTDALEFLINFESEDNYAVWDTIAAALGSIRQIMGDDEMRQAMKPYVRRLVARELKRLGWNRRGRDSHFDRLLRPIILGLAASADEPAIVEHCRQLFDKIKHVEDVQPHLRVATGRIKRGIDIDPDMRGVVFGTIARLGSEKDFDKLLKLHDEAHLSEERATLAAALTGFRQPKLIRRALALINSEHVRLQDVAYWVAYNFLNRHARTLSWRWLKENWNWLETSLGADMSFYRMPIYVARVQNDISFKKDYVEFFEPKLSPGLERSYKQGLEMIEWQSAWTKRDYKTILNFFRSR